MPRPKTTFNTLHNLAKSLVIWKKSPEKASRLMAVQRHAKLAKKFSKVPRIQHVGSLSWNTGFPFSDVDIAHRLYAKTPPLNAAVKYREFLIERKVTTKELSQIVNTGMFPALRYIMTDMREPLSIHVRFHGHQCCLERSRWVRDEIEKDLNVWTMIVLMKKWLWETGLGMTVKGGLGSYGLALGVIGFAKQETRLPIYSESYLSTIDPVVPSIDATIDFTRTTEFVSALRGLKEIVDDEGLYRQDFINVICNPQRIISYDGKDLGVWEGRKVMEEIKKVVVPQEKSRKKFQIKRILTGGWRGEEEEEERRVREMAHGGATGERGNPLGKREGELEGGDGVNERADEEVNGSVNAGPRIHWGNGGANEAVNEKADEEVNERTYAGPRIRWGNGRANEAVNEKADAAMNQWANTGPRMRWDRWRENHRASMSVGEVAHNNFIYRWKVTIERERET
ncbi:hypothetical protein RUND412_007558 [Rhizina undulata]